MSAISDRFDQKQGCSPSAIRPTCVGITGLAELIDGLPVVRVQKDTISGLEGYRNRTLADWIQINNCGRPATVLRVSF